MASGGSDESGTIVDVAAGADDFTTLVAAVEAAGLTETLAGPGPFTVFAPTDEAFTAALNVTGDWVGGHCAAVVVTNHASTATTGWSVVLDMNGTSTYTIWNGNFTGQTGTVTVTPGAPWNMTIAPGATNDTVGFCANRAVSASNVIASVVSASATY